MDVWFGKTLRFWHYFNTATRVVSIFQNSDLNKMVFMILCSHILNMFYEDSTKTGNCIHSPNSSNISSSVIWRSGSFMICLILCCRCYVFVFPLVLLLLVMRPELVEWPDLCVEMTPKPSVLKSTWSMFLKFVAKQILPCMTLKSCCCTTVKPLV